MTHGITDSPELSDPSDQLLETVARALYRSHPGAMDWETAREDHLEEASVAIAATHRYLTTPH